MGDWETKMDMQVEAERGSGRKSRRKILPALYTKNQNISVIFYKSLQTYINGNCQSLYEQNIGNQCFILRENILLRLSIRNCVEKGNKNKPVLHCQTL